MLRRLLFAASASACVAALLAFPGCTSILGDFEVASTTSEAGTGKANGQACAAPAECGSNFCTDGVCCEAACSGTCESCNLPNLAGKCMPVPDGEDPANECPTTPLPEISEDAGVQLEEDGSAPDAGEVDAGRPFDLPDGGVTTDDNQCAGKCNGKRACGFPAAERTCGTTFCGNSVEQGRASCDGKGHCLVGAELCEAFSCPDGSAGCKKTCAGESDCLPTHFCEATTSTCKAKLANGSACGSVANCQSGFCVSGVCCSSACDGFPGATCTAPGSVGQCRCNACPSGPCQLYYRDIDGDGFGDKTGTPANTRAQPGCVGSPPAGFVANNLDCLDANTPAGQNARPNQTGYLPDSYTDQVTLQPTWDYNCDGDTDKFYTNFGTNICGFCSSNKIINTCTKKSTCTTARQSAGLGCTNKLCRKGDLTCVSCTTNTATGFSVDVDCGDTATAINCGSCATAGGAVGGTTTVPNTQQRCR